MKIRNWVSIVLLLACCMLATVLAGGCKAGEVKRQADQLAQRTEQVLLQKSQVDLLLERVQAKTVTPDDAWVALVALLPPELQEQVRRAQEKGANVLATAAQVSTALGQSGHIMLTELRALQVALKDAKDSDDATTQVVWSVASGLGALFGVGGPIALFANVLGKKTGATTTAGLVAVGRAADTENAEKFFQGPAGEAMRTLLAKYPYVAKAIEAANKNL